MITTVTGKKSGHGAGQSRRRGGDRAGHAVRVELHEREHVLEVRVLQSVAEVAANLRGRGVRYRNRSDSAVDALLRERERDER